MFLRSKGFVCPAYRNISKRLLSNEVREVLNARLEPPTGTNGNQMQLAVVTKNLNALNLDLFVNSLSNYEDRRSAVLDLLAKLRSTKLANTCLESTHFAVVRHLLENSNVQELVPILLDRPQYGIFLNNFTGFAVTQTLHDEKEYILGLPLALKLVLLDELDSVFVQAFCLKSSMETLKKELSKEQTSEENAPSPPKGKVQEKKIRVHFLRNVEEVDQHKEIGKAVLKVASKVLEGNTQDNAKILGLVLTANYAELDKTLSTKTIEINADIADICKQLLSAAGQADYVNKIEQLQSQKQFGDLVDGLLTEAATKEAISLAEKQKSLLPKWQELRNQKKLEIEKEISAKERIENIENIRNEIATKKDLLWFFDQEDKLDLEIYNKRVFYPKRWFGKKKKPRVVDEDYVPPQIRKIN
ncbi:uncharacterized protein LOC119600607 [Lucilia sericata]|uniref:uncharacterized protein LOC119600607 n=1 Tax=Lucilia sericata TaxID=13632 RepID=UPI0018A7EDAB|nr:uncharacterized protein LOC119600607 [Lucilia sericata]